jgi:hypothetical protein
VAALPDIGMPGVPIDRNWFADIRIEHMRLTATPDGRLRPMMTRQRPEPARLPGRRESVLLRGLPRQLTEE